MSTQLCIACSEEIRTGAQLCKHCGTKQDDPTYTAASDVVAPEVAEQSGSSTAPSLRKIKPSVLISVITGVIVIGGLAGAVAYSSLTSWGGENLLAMPGSGEQVARNSLVEGMCLNGTPERPVSDYDTLPIVDCDEEHLEEVVATVIGNNIDTWNVGLLQSFAEQTCQSEFEEQTGTSADQSPLSYRYYLPSQTDWDRGYRAIACTIFDPRGPLTGLVDTGIEVEESANEQGVRAEEEQLEEREEATQKPSPSPTPDLQNSNEAQDALEEQRAELIEQIEVRNQLIAELAQQKRELVDQYETEYGFYTADGPLYLNGDVDQEIALKQEIADVESEIRNLEADVLILFAQLSELED